jgi:hypothetical protein
MEEDLDTSSDKFVVEIPKEKRYLNTASYDYSVNFLVDLMSGNLPKIVLEVPFQRNYIWKDERASQLIESVIMNVPIPPLYFAEEESNRWLVIDGLQRLNSIKNYFENEFSLKNLEIIKELEGLKYKDLPPKAKDLLNDGLLRVNVIKKDSHPDIKYDIFMRLNKGSVTLNYQELRNCLFRGHLNESIKKFVKENKEFQQLLNLKKEHDRYLDVEYVLRIIALTENLAINEEGEYYIKNYNGRMVNFINNFMESKSKISLDDANSYITNFKSTIDKVIAVFGISDSFKDLTLEKPRFNRAIGEFICLSFSQFELTDLQENKGEIISTLKRLLSTNIDFKQSISQRTSDADIVNKRINTWLTELNNVILF